MNTVVTFVVIVAALSSVVDAAHVLTPGSVSPRFPESHDPKRSVMEYLEATNKTHGVGFTVGCDHNINLYSEPSTSKVRSTPASYTYYFFRDRTNKYFVRDETCKFLCANPCGVVFVSPVILQHYCKFVVTQNGDAYGLYLSGATSHRVLEFDKEANLLKGRTVYNVNDTVREPTPFRFKNGPVTYAGDCVPITKVPSKNLDASGERCNLSVTKPTSYPNFDVHVKKDSKKYYKLRVETHGTLSGVFLKSVVEPNVYQLRNVETCEYMCRSSECGVYMSPDGSKEDCKIHVEQSFLRDSFYIRFKHDNYYLTVVDGELTVSHNSGSRIEFVETEYLGKPTCGDVVGVTTAGRCGQRSVGNSLTINIPQLFFFLVLNYNNRTSLV